MAFEGNLRDFGLEAIFQLINSEKKTGTLHIIRKGVDAEGFVYFRRGKIYGAVSNFNRQPIGERLVNAGHITEEQLHIALGVQKSNTKRRKLGQILISEGLITQEILRTFVKEQIQNTVFDLMPWTEGDFRFFEDQLPATEDMGLLLSAKKILSKGSARLDEWDRIRKNVPSTKAVFKSVEGAGEKARTAGLTPLHQKVADLTDGELDVSSISQAVGVSEFEVSTHLYDLVEKKLLHLVTDGAADEQSDEVLAPDSGTVSAFDVLEELELSPDDIISDRTHYINELMALTDAVHRGRRRVFLPSTSAAVLAERVHLDRQLTLPVVQQLIEYVKAL